MHAALLHEACFLALSCLSSFSQQKTCLAASQAVACLCPGQFECAFATRSTGQRPHVPLHCPGLTMALLQRAPGTFLQCRHPKGVCKKRCLTVPVLGLAGMELIFFIAAHMVLCFRFLTKTVLIAHVLAFAEQCLHSIKVFSVSHSAPQ